MAIGRQFFQKVTIVTPNGVVASRDEYNTPTYQTTSRTVMASVTRSSSDENEDGRNTLTNTYTLLCHTDVDITFESTVRWTDPLGVARTARVMGEPTIAMMRAEVHHKEATLAEIRG